jgi:Arc/MetJ-type ribon-helix-helix transcriptional regulator
MVHKVFILGKSRKTTWHVSVSETLDRVVEEAVEQDMHSTKSDLIREAVRDKLRQMGFGISPATSSQSQHPPTCAKLTDEQTKKGDTR